MSVSFSHVPQHAVYIHICLNNKLTVRLTLSVQCSSVPLWAST